MVDYRNNVIYNWVSSSACYGGEVEIPNGFAHTNIVNNFYKPGPATSSTLKFVRPDNPASAVAIARWHVKGNIMNGDANKTANNWLGVDFANIPVASRDSAKRDTAFYIQDSLPIQSAQNAYDSVLAYVGAIYPARDSTDRRIINETKTGTAIGLGSLNKLGIIDLPNAVGGWNVYNTYNVPTDTDHDGMPDFWETMKGLDINNPDDRNDTLPNTGGYTRLEEYLNSIPVANPLPARLINFSVEKLNNANKLNWAIETSFEPVSFVVEKSMDATKYLPIATIHSSQKRDYNFTDMEQLNKTVYYRIKIISSDGKYFYSPTISINNIGKNELLKVYPNPVNASSYLSIAATANNKIYLSICDINGKVYWQQNSNIVAGNNLILLPYTLLAKGIYLLKVKGTMLDESIVIEK